MRGFISVVVVLLIFVVSITMVTMSYQQNETISFKENILGAKFFLANYEITINDSQLGKNLTRQNADIEITDTSNEILSLILPGSTTCSKSPLIVESSSQGSFTLNCDTIVENTDGIIFRNEFSKLIRVQT